LIKYIFPATPTAVGNVTVKVPLVQSIVWSSTPIG
jgi:hypothetical protein